jgi:hypothetical protein
VAVERTVAEPFPPGSVVRVPDRRGHRFARVLGHRRRRDGGLRYEVDIAGRRRIVPADGVIPWRLPAPPEGRLF